MRFNDIIDYRDAKREYKNFVQRYGYIEFDEFMECEYRNLRQEREQYIFSRSFDFDSVNVSSKNVDTNDSYEYRGFFDGVSIEPMSELDRQTWSRWTKGESLQKQWNKLR